MWNPLQNLEWNGVLAPLVRRPVTRPPSVVRPSPTPVAPPVAPPAQPLVRQSPLEEWMFNRGGGYMDENRRRMMFGFRQPWLY